ncbi:MAG: hypothetical protein JW910_06135 [Anaerolineae bacterium]|nr:hypothetical protein [Anaerolineae bacterium]
MLLLCAFKGFPLTVNLRQTYVCVTTGSRLVQRVVAARRAASPGLCRTLAAVE